MFYKKRIEALESRVVELGSIILGMALQTKKKCGRKKGMKVKSGYKKHCKICNKKVKWMKHHMWNSHPVPAQQELPKINQTNI